MTTDWATKPLRVGIVGLGWTGWTHLKSYQQLPTLKWWPWRASRPIAWRSTAASSPYRISIAITQDLLARDDLDAVSVCTPNQLHAPVAIAALQGGGCRGREKPLARSGTEAAAMVAAAHSADRVLTVFNHRARGDVEALKRYIDEGGLGRIYHAKSSWMPAQRYPDARQLVHQQGDGRGRAAD